VIDTLADQHKSQESQRFWRRFRRHRTGYWSLWVFLFLYGTSLLGDVVSNDAPLFVEYKGQWYFPMRDQLAAVFCADASLAFRGRPGVMAHPRS
jgi:ABC-type microcin C transport system permease subunit YejE